MKKYVVDWDRNSVIMHPDNQLRGYIGCSGHETEKSLSYSMVEKTFYSFFIHGDC